MRTHILTVVTAASVALPGVASTAQAQPGGRVAIARAGHAAVPYGGLSVTVTGPHAKAAAIARFIDYAAGLGQVPGVAAGQLPAGYLLLPASLRAQARKAAMEILNQTGTTRP